MDTHTHRTGPRAEELEARRLLAATITNGVLVGTGTSGTDVVSIRRVLTDDVVVTINGVSKTFDMDDFTGVRLDGLGGNDTFNLDHALVAGSVIRNTTLSGGAGNDTVSYGNRTAAVALEGYVNPDSITPLPYIRATSDVNSDRLLNDVETIVGGAGNDSFRIADGQFTGSPLPALRLEGGTGIDRFHSPAHLRASMLGGLGNDWFEIGEESDAVVFGGEGDDMVVLIGVLLAGSVSGGAGTDTIRFAATYSAPTDTIDLRSYTSVENAGLDNVGPVAFIGTDGPNLIEAGAAGFPVTIRALGGDDTILGGAEDDSILGGDGNDSLTGGDGDDTLDGAAGTDTLDGGPGNDTVLNGEVTPPAGTIRIIDRTLTADGSWGGDKITIERIGGDDVIVRVNDLARQFDMDDFNGVLLRGNNGYDVLRVFDPIVAGSRVRKVTLDGGSGNDELFGADDVSDDVIRGGAGNDLLLGDDGRDALFGGGGNDSLAGGLGLDFLDGGDDDDFVNGRDGAVGDTVLGGNGTDNALIDTGDNASGVERFG